jgi:hypothetical protein
MRYLLFITVLLLIFSSCNKKVSPSQSFKEETLPQAPDYGKTSAWAALPERKDACDQYPKNYKNRETTPKDEVDVFYVYPTIYEDGDLWNADINDKKLNKKIQKLPIRMQASVFHDLAKIYSPYYRQMHIQGYFQKGGEVAFDTAYADVKRAFLYYWKHYNKNRPFVLASHSQGTNHSERLLREVILPNEEMKKQLQLAYLVGMPIEKDFEDFPPCSAAEDLNCFLSWRTYGKNFCPKEFGDSICASHPITFEASRAVNEFEEHQGILYKNFKIIAKKGVKVTQKPGYILVTGLQMPFKSFFQWENYHVADYNIFWVNLRENFKLRLKAMEEYAN